MSKFALALLQRATAEVQISKFCKSAPSQNLADFELGKPKSFIFDAEATAGHHKAPCLATLDRQNASMRPHSDPAAIQNEQIRNSIATKCCRGASK